MRYNRDENPKMEKLLRDTLEGGRFISVPPTRSQMMGRIRSTGNRSTELRLKLAMVRSRLPGWKLHPKGLTGTPDFYFTRSRVAIFVDGCFWHGCPSCGHVPRTNRRYWKTKILRNKARDLKVSRQLRAEGIMVVRFWEHQVRFDLKACIRTINQKLRNNSYDQQRSAVYSRQGGAATAVADPSYKIRTVRAQTVLPVVSLFTGAGGLDLGLRQADKGRFEFRAWVESDPDCQQTLLANGMASQERGRLFGDIEATNPDDLMKAAGLAPEETFLLAGGPPCQAFSTAGLRGSMQTPEGRVVQAYFGMVRHLRPRFFLFENVRGLLSAALEHRPLIERSHPQEVADREEHRLGSVMNLLVLPAFSRLGYEVVCGLLCSADYGTAQIRHRVFILGSRDRELGAGVFRKVTSRPLTTLDLVPPTHHRFAPYAPIAPWRTLRDSIKDLPAEASSSENSYTYSRERAAIFRCIPPGRNWKYVRDNPDAFPKRYLQEIMGSAINSGGGKEGFWRRLSWDVPAPTLTAQPQQLASSLCHPEFERPLSIPEYAALQDFPASYRFVGSKSSRYRQIGNAVPVRMATAVASSLLAVSGEA
jgi:DNA (cytosine-5)-methyltransferase 1